MEAGTHDAVDDGTTGEQEDSMTDGFATRVAKAVAATGPLCAGIAPSSDLLAAWDLPDTAVGEVPGRQEIRGRVDTGTQRSGGRHRLGHPGGESVRHTVLLFTGRPVVDCIMRPGLHSTTARISS